SDHPRPPFRHRAARRCPGRGPRALGASPRARLPDTPPAPAPPRWKLETAYCVTLVDNRPVPCVQCVRVIHRSWRGAVGVPARVRTKSYSVNGACWPLLSRLAVLHQLLCYATAAITV